MSEQKKSGKFFTFMRPAEGSRHIQRKPTKKRPTSRPLNMIFERQYMRKGGVCWRRKSKEKADSV